MRPPDRLITDAHDRVRGLYGAAIGRTRHELVTPALVLDRTVALENLRFMEERLRELPARLRAHVKNHKSPHLGVLKIVVLGLCL
jgi:D-serine deaminase-like pyridoxal phosphate-dependent protein